MVRDRRIPPDTRLAGSTPCLIVGVHRDQHLALDMAALIRGFRTPALCDGEARRWGRRSACHENSPCGGGGHAPPLSSTMARRRRWLAAMKIAAYLYCVEPLLAEPWILDVDTTIKPLYGHQEGAVLGYNPKKPGRPSHCYHTYSMASTRLVLDVDVCPGDEHASRHGAPRFNPIASRFRARPDFCPCYVAERDGFEPEIRISVLPSTQSETTGTDFQREVWAALRKIRPGTTLSYGALAQKLGRPKAVRAVGLANGANPITSSAGASAIVRALHKGGQFWTPIGGHFSTPIDKSSTPRTFARRFG